MNFSANIYRKYIARCLALIVLISGLQVVSIPFAPITSAAAITPSTCVTGSYSSCGLEYNGAEFQMSPGVSTGTGGTFTLQMWIAYNGTSLDNINSGSGSFLFGSTVTNGFGLWLQSKTLWQLDSNGNTSRVFTCPALSLATWVGIVISQSSNGPAMWMNGSKCSVNYTSVITLATDVGATTFMGGISGSRAADKWNFSNVRFDTDAHYDTSLTTITPDSFPLSARPGYTQLLMSSNDATATTDSSGYQTLAKVGTSSNIAASPNFTTPQTITFTQPANMSFNDVDQSITVSSTSNLNVAVTSSTPLVCTIIAGKIHAVSPGSCLIKANQEGNSTYSAATEVQKSITISKSAQTISFTQPADMTFNDPDQSLTFSSNSGLSVTLTSSTTPVCTIASSKIKIVAAGTCTVNANQSGDTNYNAATQVSRSITISRATSAITANGSTTYTYSGLAQGPSSSTKSGSGGAVTYSYQGTGSTIYSASTTKPTNAGTYTVTATVAEDNGYSSATSTPLAFSIEQISESSGITITSVSATYGTNLSLTTSGASGGTGAVTFNVVSGSCTISGSTLTSTAAGTCMVTATKATDGNYLAATSPSTAITVSPKGLTISGLTGVNKEFDRGLVGTATGTPTLVGKVGSDDVLLAGTPTFTFASANVADGISLVASGYTLTGSTAGNYTLTQPTVTANITAKAARISATNTTVAYGATVTSGFTTSGLISPDAVGSASYTYTGTGTATPPTAVGVYTVTPSNAVFSTGLIGNYTITFDTATVTILAKYTITYNANGGVVASSSTTTVDFVVGDTALTLPTPSRSNYRFLGWYTLESNGVQVTGAYTPTATATLWAHWIQNSLDGMGSNTNIFTLIISNGGGWDVAPSAGGGTVGVNIPAGALADGTVVTGYLLSDTSTATSVIGSGNDYVMSLVLAWVHPATGLVENTATGKPITMTITNSVIKKGAKIYSVIGSQSRVLTTASVDGIAVIQISEDPQIIIAITKPDAPIGVSATSGGNASTTVSWTAPSDGGSAITSYTATSNAGQTCSSSTTSCSITGLTNGTPYTFTVTATNSIGTSDPSSASSAATPAAPVVTPPSSGGGGGSTYVPPTPTVDPAVAAAATAKALADAKAAEEKAIADAKALAEKRAAEEAALLATIKALQDKADADSLAAAKKLADELAAAQLKAEEELKAAAALKLAEEQRLAAERSAAAKKITTFYSLNSAFKLNTTYTKRLNTYTKKIATGSTVTCIGYAKSSKTLSYAKAKVVATMQAKALCSSMKKINPTLMTKSIVYPASKAPVITVNKKWIPVSYRVEAVMN